MSDTNRRWEQENGKREMGDRSSDGIGKRRWEMRESQMGDERGDERWEMGEIRDGRWER
jgi:hypothetical protein